MLPQKEKMGKDAIIGSGWSRELCNTALLRKELSDI